MAQTRKFSPRFILAIAGLFAALLIALPSVALARDYEMPSVAIDATVSPDGTLSVVEDRTYAFDGSFNGVYWDIPVGTYGGRAVDVNVTGVGVLNGTNFEPFTESPAEASGNYSVASLINDNDTPVERVKLYSSQTDTKVTFRLTYTLTGGVSAWSDTGELYWKFVSDGWEVESENVTCTVHLPVPADATVVGGDNVRAWGHGPLDASVKFDGSDVVFVVPGVGTSEFAEARIAFPVEWLTGMTPSDTPRLDTIMSEEGQWVTEANNKRSQARTVTYGGAGAVVVAALAGLANSIRLRRKYKDSHAPVFNDPYFRDVPSKDHPAVIGCLYAEGKVENQFFTAALMNLTDQGVVGLDHVTTRTKRLLGGFREKDDYRLSRRSDAAKHLTDPVDVATFELVFHDFVALRHGTDVTGDEVLFSDLKKLAKRDPEEYMDAIHEWEGAVTGEAERRGFFTDSGTSQTAVVATGGVLTFFGFVAFIVMMVLTDGLLVSALSSIVMIASGVACLVMGHGMSSLSREAIEIKAKTVALRKWLLEFTRLGEAVPSDVILWNKLLVMAVVLGVADEVIKQLEVVMPDIFQDDNFMPVYGWYMGYGSFGAPADVLGNSFSEAHQVGEAALADSSDSSFSGGGGGFSGGGGGGFGGGGGGGAF